VENKRERKAENYRRDHDTIFRGSAALLFIAQLIMSRKVSLLVFQFKSQNYKPICVSLHVKRVFVIVRSWDEQWNKATSLLG
jgi:hypothetical protein